jgi:hypothetical protein
MNERTLELLQELLKLSLKARYGCEVSRQQMRDEHAVLSREDLRGFTQGVTACIRTIELHDGGY